MLDFGSADGIAALDADALRENHLEDFVRNLGRAGRRRVVWAMWLGELRQAALLYEISLRQVLR